MGNPTRTNPSSISRDLERAVQRLGRLVPQPRRHFSIVGTSEVLGSRRVTFQVRDVDGRDAKERVLGVFWISTTEYGAPTSNQEVTIVKGAVLQTILANSAYLMCPDSEGVVEFLCYANTSQAGNRHFHGVCINPTDLGSFLWGGADSDDTASMVLATVMGDVVISGGGAGGSWWFDVDDHSAHAMMTWD